MDSSNQCVRKQNNVYFHLKELDTSAKQAIVQSVYDNRYYKVTYYTGCYSFSFQRYVNKNIVINLGTDYDLDRWDKIVLQDDDEVCDITQRERADSSTTLTPKSEDNDTPIFTQCPIGETRIGSYCYTYDIGCMASFGDKAKWSLNFNSEGQYTCNCKTGYQWSADGQSCSVIPTDTPIPTTTMSTVSSSNEKDQVDMGAFCKTTLGEEATFDPTSKNCSCPQNFELKRNTCVKKTRTFLGTPKTKTDLAACAVIVNKRAKIYYLRGHKLIQQMTPTGKECVATEQIAKSRKYKIAK